MKVAKQIFFCRINEVRDLNEAAIDKLAHMLKNLKANLKTKLLYITKSLTAQAKKN